MFDVTSLATYQIQDNQEVKIIEAPCDSKRDIPGIIKTFGPNIIIDSLLYIITGCDTYALTSDIHTGDHICLRVKKVTLHRSNKPIYIDLR